MFFERPDSGERAVLVHLSFSRVSVENDPREFEELVLSAGGDPVTFVTGSRDTPHIRYYVGTGKLEELKAAVKAAEAEIVIFNHDMSPSQERNLEKELECRVLDRTGLILDIFAQRARTHEGKLQVELAQLQHMSTRLVRGWTHLERQKGGIGLRGPGETQLETDRRLLRERMKSIQKRLDKVRKQRDQGRRSRDRADIPTVSLVGYTNVGKSSLFNLITDADVYAENQLFATLDPTMRRVELADAGPMVLADTVGFISHLPHKLVEAFSATLEEAANSSLLLHVIDAADEEREHNIAQVEEVLKEIKAFDLPTLRVYNKIDLLNDFSPRIDRGEDGSPIAVWVSVHAKLGIELLLQALNEHLAQSLVEFDLTLSPAHGKFRAALFSAQAIKSETISEQGDWELNVKITKRELGRVLKASEMSDEAFAALQASGSSR